MCYRNGSNSCYFDGEDLKMSMPSVGSILMDTACGNYFIGAIAHYFRDILGNVACKNNLRITGVTQRPWDCLLE